jgi:hypothetical protein
VFLLFSLHLPHYADFPCDSEIVGSFVFLFYHISSNCVSYFPTGRWLLFFLLILLEDSASGNLGHYFTVNDTGRKIEDIVMLEAGSLNLRDLTENPF